MLEQKYKIPTIPIACVKVKGIFPEKVQTCKKQVMLEIKVGTLITNHIFLVLSRIKFGIILGIDFIKEYGGVINFQENTFTLNVKDVNECISLNPKEDELELYQSIWNMTIEQDQEEIVKNHEIMKIKVEEASLNSELKPKLMETLLKYEKVFGSEPGKILNFQYQLRVVDWEPYQKRPYPVPEKYREQVEIVIKQMCEAGIISLRTTPFANALVVVQKPDGSVRVCLDARALNEKLIPEYDSVPNIKDIIRKFEGMKYYTLIDLTASYHHVELEEESKLLTGFWFNQRTYVFNRLPFGIMNSGSALIRALDRNLESEIKDKIVKYVDDIILATPDLESHFVWLSKLLANLSNCHFKVNLKKSKFIVEEILFVGHMVSFHGIKPNPIKIKAIQDFPKPIRLKQVRQFLGMCQFFANHCKNYTETVAPLQEMLKKQNRWKWGPDQDKSFIETKRIMSENIELSYPNFSLPFIVQTDASFIGVGATLYQVINDQESQKQYLAFASRRLRKHETLYSITEIEMLAVVFALRQWRKIIYGFKVILRTDHRALTFMMKTCIASERVRRWALYVQQYDIEIQHCPGKENVIADVLSRNPGHEEPEMCNIELIAEDREILAELRNLRVAQEQEAETRQILNYLRGDREFDDKTLAKLRKLAEEYHIVNNLLHKFIDSEHSKLRVVIPNRLQKPLILHVHRIIGHGGIDKVCQTLKETFTWIRMRKLVREYVTSCDICQRIKANTFLLRQEPIPLLPRYPKELYACDLYGPLPKGQRGNRYIFVIVDVFSKYTNLYPIQKATTRHVLRRIRNNVIPAMGQPKYLISDHGSQFTSQQFQDGMEDLNITHVMSSIRHPEGNPSERVIREVARYCRLYCHEEHWKWVQNLPKIVNCVNSVFHESIQEIPSVVHCGIYPERPWKEVVNCPPDMRPSQQILIDKVREELKRRADKRLLRWRGKRFHRKLRVGELVLVKKPAVSRPELRRFKKFEFLFHGPYRIVRVLNNNAYRVESMDGQVISTYNAANLKLYKTALDD